MLNEYKEYEEYTQKIVSDCDFIPRLDFTLFTSKNRGGLQRALITIARYYLFDKYDYKNAHTEDEMNCIREKAIDALKAWIGFEGDWDIEEYPFAGWLKEYYDYFYSKKGTKKIPTYEDMVATKFAQYDKSAFAPLFFTGNNSNALTFGTVIADAINQGPLNKYYLLCKQDFHESIYENYKKIGDIYNKKASQKTIKNADRFLKLLSSYLIAQKQAFCSASDIYKDITDEIFFQSNKIDLANWMQYTSYGNSSGKLEFTYSEDDKHHTPIIKSVVITGNVRKITVMKSYIDKYDISIVPAKKDFVCPEGYTFFSDAGAKEGSVILSREIVYPQ